MALRPTIATAWFGSLWRDDVLRRLIRNVGYLLTGTGGAAILGLGSLAMAARTLGPELLGVIAMIEAYANTVNRLLRPETWQALIKYGAGLLERDENEAFAQLMKFGIVIDVVGALVATAVAIGGLQLFGHWLGFDDQIILLGSLYCLVLLPQLNSTPTAILRLFDRFGVFAWRQILAAGIRFVLVGIAFLLHAGLPTFLAISMVLALAEPILLIGAARAELRARGFERVLASPLRGCLDRFAGIWGFIWSTNLSLILRKSTQELDILIVGSQLGPAAAGLYQVAKRLGEMVMKLGAPIQQAIYPDMARLWVRGEHDRFRRTLFKINLSIGVVAFSVLAVLLFEQEAILHLIVGEAFLAAGPLLLTHMLAMAIFLCGITLRPALFSMGRQNTLLAIVVVATAAFYATLLLALPQLGALGASIAHVVFNLIWLAATTWVVVRGAPAGAAAGVQPDPA
jgi:O-antigen/teichoic acid export membrane protein